MINAMDDRPRDTWNRPGTLCQKQLNPIYPIYSDTLIIDQMKGGRFFDERIHEGGMRQLSFVKVGDQFGSPNG